MSNCEGSFWGGGSSLYVEKGEIKQCFKYCHAPGATLGHFTSSTVGYKKNLIKSNIEKEEKENKYKTSIPLLWNWATRLSETWLVIKYYLFYKKKDKIKLF